MTSIFGGGTSEASEQTQAAQLQSNRELQRFIRERSLEARQDVTDIFPEAQRVGAEGFQGALDVISQGLPQQLGAFQQGNIGAQQIISQSLPQIQNAILGLPVNQAAFQPRNINFDPSFLQNLTAPRTSPVALQPPAPLQPLNPFAQQPSGDGRSVQDFLDPTTGAALPTGGGILSLFTGGIF